MAGQLGAWAGAGNTTGAVLDLLRLRKSRTLASVRPLPHCSLLLCGLSGRALASSPPALSESAGWFRGRSPLDGECPLAARRGAGPPGRWLTGEWLRDRSAPRDGS